VSTGIVFDLNQNLVESLWRVTLSLSVLVLVLCLRSVKLPDFMFQHACLNRKGTCTWVSNISHVTDGISLASVVCSS